PPISPLFPYTTLFRSIAVEVLRRRDDAAADPGREKAGAPVREGPAQELAAAVVEQIEGDEHGTPAALRGLWPDAAGEEVVARARSEEHTSELQSPCNL